MEHTMVAILPVEGYSDDISVKMWISGFITSDSWSDFTDRQVVVCATSRGMLSAVVHPRL